ncbi:MAG: hypothetical protein WCJ25_03355 [Candidatus Moraniibacteriota bacterium]
MNKTAHRIRKRLIVSLVAVFLSALVVVPSVPVKNLTVRNSVETLSSMNDQGVEEKIDPEEDPGREESLSNEAHLTGA